MFRRGFTLIEMVLTLLVSSILVLGIAGFIELGVTGYADSVDRQRLQTQAKFVLEKMTREVRHAVPNIFISGGNCFSFYPIVDSGFYVVSGGDINFIVGDPDASVATLKDKYLLIHPSQSLVAGQNLTALTNSFPLANMVEHVSSGAVGLTFSLPDRAKDLVGGSVSQRQYLTDINRQISYCIIGERVVRGEGDGNLPLTTQPLTDHDSALVTGTLSYTPATVQHNGVVHIDLNFTQNDESTRFQQDVQVLNVP